MNEEKVSVVLPIYNVENDLDRCIQSVVGQSYRNLEIILVDDGSPDRCPQLCDAWAEKDSRIVVVHKANAGLGMARNTGIETATGSYILFVDSDDYIAPDTVEKALAAAREHNAELVVYGMHHVNKDGTIRDSVVPSPDKTCYSGSEVQEQFLPDLIWPDLKHGKPVNLQMSACVCMFSMKVIREHNWRFASEREIISEDEYSLLKLYRHVNSVAVIREAFYHYCTNEASLTHTYREDRFEKILHCYNACAAVCKANAYGQEVEERLRHQLLSNLIGAMKTVCLSGFSKQEQRQIFRRIAADPALQRIIGETDPGYETFNRRVLLWTIRHKNAAMIRFLIGVKAR